MKTYKDWICRYYSEHEDGEPDGEIIQELIRCRDCRSLLTVAWIGDEAEPYAWMCDHWHMSTEPEGHCHRAERKDEDA